MELFTHICKYSFELNDHNLFLPHYQGYMDAGGIAYSDVMKLSEFGLIFDNAMLRMEFELPEEPAILSVNKELVLTISSSETKNKKGKYLNFRLLKLAPNWLLLLGICPQTKILFFLAKK